MYLFDDRSSRAGRLTGWERFTIEVGQHLKGEQRFAGTNLSVEKWSQRLKSDWWDLPRLAHDQSYSGALLPTFPPTPRLEKKRTIWILHDLTWLTRREWASRAGRFYYGPLAQRALDRVTHLVTVSDAVRAEMIELGVHPERVTRVYPGGPNLVEQSGPPIELATERPFVLAVGTLDPRKNLRLLYEAWSSTRLRDQFDLVVAGRIAWDGRPPDWVIHIDRPTDACLAWLYRNCASFVQPSLYEGFGLPVIEAAAYGAPVACSDIPVFREVAPTGAEFFDPTSVEALRVAVERSSAKGAYASVSPDLAQYSWSETASELTRLCDRWLA